MKRKIGLLALVGVILLSSTPAGADFYVIAGGGPPVGTKITTAPYTITLPGFYFLGKDLFCPGGGTAITILAPHVTLDLMGFNLIGAGGGSGIALMCPENVEIRNGTIINFLTGVDGSLVPNSNNHRLINVRIEKSLTIGAIFPGRNCLVKDCAFTDNTAGGLKVGAGTISGCVSCDNGYYGIWLDGPGSVIENIANNNGVPPGPTGAYNFYLGTGGLNTPIMVNGNSASSLAPNYFMPPGSGGVVIGMNAGLP